MIKKIFNFIKIQFFEAIDRMFNSETLIVIYFFYILGLFFLVADVVNYYNLKNIYTNGIRKNATITYLKEIEYNMKYQIKYEFKYKDKMYSYRYFLVKNSKYLVEAHKDVLNGGLGAKIEIRFLEKNPWKNYFFYETLTEDIFVYLYGFHIVFLVPFVWHILIIFYCKVVQKYVLKIIW